MAELIKWFLGLPPWAQAALVVWLGYSIGNIGNSHTTNTK